LRKIEEQTKNNFSLSRRTKSQIFNLRTNFTVNVLVCKIATSAAQLTNCILLYAHAQLRLPAVRAQTKTSLNLFNELAVLAQ